MDLGVENKLALITGICHGIELTSIASEYAAFSFVSIRASYINKIILDVKKGGVLSNIEYKDAGFNRDINAY